jgi:nucleoid-associated protein YgaU
MTSIFSLKPPTSNQARLLIIGAAFLAVTLGLILLQPASPTPAGIPHSVTAKAPGPVAPAPQTDPLQTVARADTSLIALDPPKQATPAVDDITANVLATLTGSLPQSAATPAPQATDMPTTAQDPLRSLTSGVIASLSGTPTQQAAPRSMEQLVVQALKQGQSDAYIDALLNEAASAGQIEVPGALRTNAGRVDTATLLADLVRKSNPGAASALPAPQGEGVEVRVVQRAGKTQKYNFYTVQSGDSLGAIARKFYGDAALYSAIFRANRQILSSPDRVRVGQRLSIPEVTQG